MTKPRKLKFQFGQSSKNGQWYWRIRAKNGEIIAQGEGYQRKRDAVKIFRTLQDAFDHFLVVEQELDKWGYPIRATRYVGTLVG